MRVTRPSAGSAPEVSVQLIPGAVTTADVRTPLDARSECRSMQTSNSELEYVGEDHWMAILDSIADLKDYLDREEQLRFAEGPKRDEPGSSEPAFIESARPKALPPKYVVDRHITQYFNYLNLVSSLLSMD
ncbi:hypothetical protein BDW75DRAFT_241014 [Aspergillus navahoensis]